MNSLIILADLGRVKAYRITCDDDDPRTSPAFEDVLDVDLQNQHSKVSERYTDKAGRFAYGKGSQSVGENHNEEDEAEAQQMGSVADVIQEAAKGDSDIYFAAPKEIVADLQKTLDAALRKRIKKTLELNLVKTPKLELLDRFGLD
ncbi:MAG: host attachment protein [Akkermansiaceae bacterium]|nr:host attachment protein [Akkermansiaceae bacterium]